MALLCIRWLVPFLLFASIPVCNPTYRPPSHRLECPEVHATVKNCTASHDYCVQNSESPEDAEKCDSEYENCVASPFLNSELSSTCRQYLFDTKHSIWNAGRSSVLSKRSEAFKRFNETIFPVYVLLGNSSTVSYKNLPEAMEYFFQSARTASQAYKQNIGGIEKALAKIEEENLSILKVPFSQWYGGFGDQISKVIDRNAVVHFCGSSVSSEFAQYYARSADCLEKRNSHECVDILVEDLKMSAKSSDKPTVCKLYVEAIDMSKSQIADVDHDHHHFYRKASFILNQKPDFTKLYDDSILLVARDKNEVQICKACEPVKREHSAIEIERALCGECNSCDQKRTERRAMMKNVPQECRDLLYKSNSYIIWMLISGILLVLCIFLAKKLVWWIVKKFFKAIWKRALLKFPLLASVVQVVIDYKNDIPIIGNTAPPLNNEPESVPLIQQKKPGGNSNQPLTAVEMGGRRTSGPSEHEEPNQDPGRPGASEPDRSTASSPAHSESVPNPNQRNTDQPGTSVFNPMICNNNDNDDSNKPEAVSNSNGSTSMPDDQDLSSKARCVIPVYEGTKRNDQGFKSKFSRPFLEAMDAPDKNNEPSTSTSLV